jgi:tRNA pseudouridine55 synthase
MSPVLDGILNLDKPAGPSSAAVVAAVKRRLPRGTRIGHAGSLDPFATGVLLLLIGAATRQCERLMDLPKQYRAVVRLGQTTPTDDPESPPVPYPADAIAPSPSLEQVREALRRFVGAIQQRPPAYSAIKVAGRRAYKLARQGRPPELPPRTVQVYALELLDYQWPLATLLIDCGRGTYIRSIARDLGEALRVGGHLAELRRTRIGPYEAEKAIPLSRVQTAEPSEIAAWLSPGHPSDRAPDNCRTRAASPYNRPPPPETRA